MVQDFTKQANKPLFPKVLWNRPINRGAAGRLLLIGGHKSEFSEIQAVYQLALAAGAGECRVVMPDSLQKLLAGVPDSSFVPSSPSGSIGKGALAEILHMAQDYDAVILGASLSNNSETAILVESLLSKLTLPAIVFGEALLAVKHNYQLITERTNSLIIASMQQIFKLAGGLKIPLNIKADNSVINKIEIMQEVASHNTADYLICGLEMIVASESRISLTTAVSAMDFFTLATVAVASVFWVQNRSNRFAGLTTAAFILQQARAKIATTDDKPLITNEVAAAIQKVLAEQG